MLIIAFKKKIVHQLCQVYTANHLTRDPIREENLGTRILFFQS
jgi:hypothetical protein